MVHLIDALSLLYGVFKYCGYDKVEVTTLANKKLIKDIKNQLQVKLERHFQKLKSDKDNLIVAVFDVSFDTFRRKLFPDYKKNRLGNDQIPFIQNFQNIKELFFDGMFIVDAPVGYEADDVIATLCKKAKEWGKTVKVHTADSDLLQLVDKEVTVLMYSHKAWKYGEPSIYKQPGFQKKNYGIKADQVAFMKALAGDLSDNIPGFLCYRDANRLLRTFGDLDAIFQNLNKLELQHREILLEHKDSIYRNLKLTVLKSDLDIDLPCHNNQHLRQ